MKLPGNLRFLLTALHPQRKAPDPRFALSGTDADLHGKTVVFTGGTDGMGRVAVEMLHTMGADVILLGRDEAKGKNVISAMASSVGVGTARFEICDLLSMKSILECAKRILSETNRIDVLVNCAGANFQERVVTADGFERNWAVNYAAPFLLTHLLLERLESSAPSRIVNVSSAGEAFGHIDFDDLQLERGYSPGKAYSRAKLALNMFTVDLSKALAGTEVTVNSLNPGFIKSNLLRDLRGFEAIGRPMMQLLASPAEVGADRIVRLSVSSEYAGVSGEFVYEDSIRPPNPEALDHEVVSKLMQLTRMSLSLDDAQQHD